jgi:hypothetical protein
MTRGYFALISALLLVSAVATPLAAQPPQSVSPGSSLAASSNVLSESWQETLRGFDEWSRVQQVYLPQQIVEMRRKMLDKATSLSPAESERFRGEISAKLHVLMSAEARDARKWLADTLAVASDSYAEKIRAKLPDITKESARQLQADLDAFEARESNVKQYQKGLQETRQMAIRELDEEARRQAESNAQAHVGTNYNPAPGGAAIGGPGAYGRYVSPYGPTLPYGFGLRFW